MCWVVLLNQPETIFLESSKLRNLWESKFSIRNVKLNVKSCQNELLCLLFANKRHKRLSIYQYNTIPTVNFFIKKRNLLLRISWEIIMTRMIAHQHSIVGQRIIKTFKNINKKKFSNFHDSFWKGYHIVKTRPIRLLMLINWHFVLNLNI